MLNDWFLFIQYELLVARIGLFSQRKPRFFLEGAVIDLRCLLSSLTLCAW